MSSELVRTREQFEVWRAGRTRGDRIPAKLWKQAVKLAGRHGVSRISSALKLDYYTLKNRLERERYMRSVCLDLRALVSRDFTWSRRPQNSSSPLGKRLPTATRRSHND